MTKKDDKHEGTNVNDKHETQTSMVNLKYEEKDNKEHTYAALLMNMDIRIIINAACYTQCNGTHKRTCGALRHYYLVNDVNDSHLPTIIDHHHGSELDEIPPSHTSAQQLFTSSLWSCSHAHMSSPSITSDNTVVEAVLVKGTCIIMHQPHN